MRETKVIDVSQVRLGKVELNPKILEIISFISQGGIPNPVHLTPTGTGQYLCVDKRSKFKVTAAKLMGLPLIVARFSRKMRKDVH